MTVPLLHRSRPEGSDRSDPDRSDRSRLPFWWAGSVVLLLLVATAALAVGTRTLGFAEVLDLLLHPDDSVASSIVHDYRVPRLGLGIAVGAALAVAGALAQSLTRNPLAEPGLLGVTAGAAMGVMLSSALWSVSAQGPLLVAAAVGASVATAVVFLVGGADPLRLVLAGTALSALCAGAGLGIRLVLPDVFDTYRFWSVGSLAGRENVPLTVPVLVLLAGLVLAAFLVPALHAMAAGDDVATGLGVAVQRTRVLTLAAITLLAATATAVAGPVVFVGLIVPHAVRRLCRGSIGWLLAFCLVLGPVLMVASDVVARLLLPTGEVPVSIVTAFVGGPVLIWVIRRYGAMAL